METTTIKVSESTKGELDNLRVYKNESYDELLRKVLHIAKLVEKEPKLSQKTVKDIKEARNRIKKGEFYTEEEARKILGV